ncbi:hypothetical protein B296_00053889 [Ensete ventricosum]|uniref:mannan endo-1,4-beta-mannosidase n=1 Tax=Ensete ventricosum TaxID=4639 RepID=A0A426X9Y8_ENSVE|nr:hypothetical protein B296_00053889 [Ensete ventricosum]
MSFVGRNGTRFTMDGKAFYVNGWNSYWLMDQAVEEISRPRVKAMFQAGAKMGLTVCRTWAFNDGGYNSLQVSLGHFDEHVFQVSSFLVLLHLFPILTRRDYESQALDRVIVEAKRHGIRLLLSLANNLEAYGGKTQYVKWAWEEGIGLSSSNDSFFFDPSIRSYFKTYLKDWIEELAAYVKSIDKKHLLTVGLEGFYGPASSPEKLKVNPGRWFSTLGSDFIRNSKVSDIDFASVHIYPDQWQVGAGLEEKMKYISGWLISHMEDGEEELKKPVLFTEFGLSDKSKDFDHAHRDVFYESIFDAVYESARRGGAGAGALVWQFMAAGMQGYSDDFGIVPEERPSMYRLIKKQSCRLMRLSHGRDLLKRKNSEKLCAE